MAQKEKLEEAKRLYQTANADQRYVLESLFPELKESEDEKVRKALISILKSDFEKDTTINDISVGDIITWLEKQKNCEYIKKDWLEHIKQSWYKEGFIDGKYTPKEWTINDATTLNGLIDFLENGTAKLQHDLTLYANWLKTQFSPIEKQGEQKPTLRERYKNIAESEWFKKTHDGMSVSDDEKVNNVNKIEPKFKDGDYIKHNKANIICKIISVNNGSYYVENICTSGRIELFNAEQNFHLWTIADAKNGDVLATLDYILIFEKVLSKDYGVSHCHYGFGNTTPQFNFNKDDNWYFGKEAKVYPATKEQRDLLFQKMKEAGYEWDAEKKELKKIHVIDEGKAEIDYCFTKMMNGEKVSPVWGEEDEKMVKDIIAAIDALYYHGMVNWLKSLKDRVYPQNQWKPSDEQMNDLKKAIDSFTFETDYLQELYEDLKKLKGE